MKKKLLPILTIAVMMFVGACSNDDIIPEKKIEVKPERSISLTVNTPSENSTSIKENTPKTRVALTQEEKKISLAWEVGDAIQFAFVQGSTKEINTVFLKDQDITNNGKSAKLEIILPIGIDDTKPFDIYGVYGGGEIDITGENPAVKLPTNAGDATSLADVQIRKDVMLYFKSENINAADSQVSITFQHLGSLFSITLSNNTGTDLANIQGVRLVGIDNSGNENWAYNFAEGGQSFDLVTGAFQNTTSGGNYISFKVSKTTLEKQKSITYWAWYPPLSDKTWPALQLQLTDGSTIYKTSVNNTTARIEPTVAGKSYYFYAGWDGTELTITREYSVDVEAMGSLSTLLTSELKKSIRKLTVTGQINKSDFNVMKNDMPNLTALDLSAAISYEGKTENKIPSSAFGGTLITNGNQNITSVILPTTVTDIGDFAFSLCRGLSGELNLPDGLKTIGASAFKECQNLTGSLTIPDGVTTIENHAFYNCIGFNGALTLSTELVKVGHNAFRNLLNIIDTLTIPGSVTTIEFNAFYQCWKLTGLVFEDSEDNLSIGNQAFQNCKAVVGDIVFPSRLASIGDSGFDNCLLASAFQFTQASPIAYTSNMIHSGKPVKVPAAALQTYKDADGWKDLPEGTITGY